MENFTSKWVLGHHITTHPTSGNYDLAKGKTPPYTKGPPPHSHKILHEVFLIIEGKMDFVVQGKKRTLSSGEMVDLPPNAIHTFINPYDQPCTWVNIHSPKGFMQFFNKIGIEDSHPNAQELSKQADKIQQVMELSKEMDMTFHLES